MTSRKSAIRSGLISASTQTTNGFDLRAVDDNDGPIFNALFDGDLGAKEETRLGTDNDRYKSAKRLLMLRLRRSIVVQCSVVFVFQLLLSCDSIFWTRHDATSTIKTVISDFF